MFTFKNIIIYVFYQKETVWSILHKRSKSFLKFMITSYFVVDDFMQVHTPIKSRRKLEKKYSIFHNFINLSEKQGLYFEINLLTYLFLLLI